MHRYWVALQEESTKLRELELLLLWAIRLFELCLKADIMFLHWFGN